MVSRRPTWMFMLCGVALNAGCGPEGLDEEFPNADEVGFVHQAATCPNGGNVKPATPSFGSSIDSYASYDGQDTCSPTAKPGVKAFRELVLATYPCTSSGGIVRACNVGGTSEHKEGRAWDWMINVGHPAADALLTWLLKTDAQGHKHANARRVGIMYIVWNRKMWRAYRPGDGWQPYSGSNPHTDHVHFSFSWAGANKKTSFFNAPTTCTPACDGTKLMGTNCKLQTDCSTKNAACVDDSLGARCVSKLCPATGQRRLCVNSSTLGVCDDGKLTKTSCSAKEQICKVGAVVGCGAPVGPPPDLGAPEPDSWLLHADDAGPMPHTDGGIWGQNHSPDPDPTLQGGCSVARCTAQASGWWPLGLLLLVLGRRRSRAAPRPPRG